MAGLPMDTGGDTGTSPALCPAHKLSVATATNVSQLCLTIAPTASAAPASPVIPVAPAIQPTPDTGDVATDCDCDQSGGAAT